MIISSVPADQNARTKRRILVATSLVTSLSMFDSNIVAVSLPSIARTLGASFSDIEWVISAYLLPFAALLLGAGSFAERHGRKRTTLIGLVIFAVASGLCGAAQSVLILDLARALQSIGASLLVPAGLAVINYAFPARERARAYALAQLLSSRGNLLRLGAHHPLPDRGRHEGPQFVCGRRQIVSRHQAQFDGWQSRETEFLTHIANPRRNAVRRPNGDAVSKFQRSPNSGQARRRQGQSPCDAFAVKRLERRLPKQARMIEENQWNTRRWLREWLCQLCSGEPEQRQRRQERSGSTASRAKKSQGQIQLTRIYLVLERVVAPGTHVDMHARPLPREPHDRIGHDVFKEILRKPHADRRRSSRGAQRRGRLVMQSDNAARISQQGFSGHKTATITLEQRSPRLLLEPLQLHADGRLGATELHRCARKASELRADHDRPQRIDVEGGSHISDLVKYQFDYGAAFVELSGALTEAGGIVARERNAGHGCFRSESWLHRSWDHGRADGA